MKTKLIILILSIIMILSACSNNENKNEKLSPNNNGTTENKANDNDNSTQNIINLAFTPVPKTALIEQLPEEGWVLGKSIYFGNLSEQVESTVHLYIDNNGNPDLKPCDGIIYGFLEYEDKFYELGVVSSYGIDYIDVNLADRTFDKIKEIHIVGDMGATSRELKIISYNKTNQGWENLLTISNPQIVDLDNDSKEELLAVSMGSLPPFVEIYKWNNDHFEKADIAEATGSLYAKIDTINNEWIIETGLQGSEETTFYKYEDGNLIKHRELQ